MRIHKPDTSLQSEIINDDIIPVFYKKHLLNAISLNIDIMGFKPEQLFIIYTGNIDINSIVFKANNQTLEENIRILNSDTTSKGLRVHAYCEILGQYDLMDNFEMYIKYEKELEAYLLENLEYNGKFDYIAFTILLIYISNSLIVGKFGSIVFVFLMNWINRYMDTLDYYMINSIDYLLEEYFDKIDLSNSNNEILGNILKIHNSYVERKELVYDSYPGEEYLENDYRYFISRECYYGKTKEEIEKLKKECAETLHETMLHMQRENHTKEEYEIKYKEIIDSYFPPVKEEIDIEKLMDGPLFDEPIWYNMDKEIEEG